MVVTSCTEAYSLPWRSSTRLELYLLLVRSSSEEANCEVSLSLPVAGTHASISNPEPSLKPFHDKAFALDTAPHALPAVRPVQRVPSDVWILYIKLIQRCTDILKYNTMLYGSISWLHIYIYIHIYRCKPYMYVYVHIMRQNCTA